MFNFWKRNTNEETYESVFEALIEKRRKINDLDFENAIHRKAVYHYVKEKPNCLEDFKTEKEKDFLSYLVKRDYKFFLYLKPEQYDEELAKHFLIERLKEDKDTTAGFVRKSFDENLVFSMYYDTRNGEQIFYFDKDIQSTTFLVSKFDISFKVNSVVKLLKKLDVSVSMFGYNVLFNELMCWVNKEYRKTIFKFINTKDIGVYKINALYDEIEKETTSALNHSLADAGVVVQKMAIQKLSISENAAKILEKEGLDRIREKNKREAELEYEKQALENYAKKAKIHKENPDFELTLTEAEKDFALDRYITKQLADKGKLKDTQVIEELAERKKKTLSPELKKGANRPFLQEEKVKSNSGLLIVGGILLVVSLLMFLSNTTAIPGVIYLVIGLAFLGCGIFLKYKNSKENTNITSHMKEEYEAKMEEYKENNDKGWYYKLNWLKDCQIGNLFLLCCIYRLKFLLIVIKYNKEENGMKTLIDYYDDFAKSWADKWYPDESVLPYLKQFAKHLPKNARVLDLCCGAGYESMRLNKLGMNVVGIDLSKESIKLARKYNPTIQFHIKNMLESYKDLGSFDGVACIAGLVHIPEGQLDLAFKNMYEVLKDEAYLFVVVKDGQKVIKSIEIDGHEYAREFYCYTFEKLMKHAEKYFCFVEEFQPNEDWRYYLFKKNKI